MIGWMLDGTYLEMLDGTYLEMPWMAPIWRCLFGGAMLESPHPRPLSPQIRIELDSNGRCIRPNLRGEGSQ
jgi:hypothetical protein